jgi:hypothetical protein
MRIGIRDGDSSDPGSGMEKTRIRDPGWKKLRSGINIPDPQHWQNVVIKKNSVKGLCGRCLSV